MGVASRKFALTGNDPVIVTVTTGDIKYAGTDNDVMIRFTDVSGKKTRDLKLDNLLKNDFEKGQTDTFTIRDISLNVEGGFGEISHLEIWRKKVVLDDALFLNVLEAERLKAETKHIFPIHRWIPMDKTMCIRIHDAYLPQEELFIEQRLSELERKRQFYRLKEKVSGIPPQCEELPEDESFSDEYQFDLKSRKRKLFLVSKMKVITTSSPTTMNDFKKLYTSKTLPLPEAAQKDWFLKDEYFGEQRVSGCNPLQITLCTSIPQNFAVTNEMVEPFLENKTLKAVMEEKRLFIIDYVVLEGIEKTDPDRAVGAPLALLYRNTEDQLLPIAIQLQQKPCEDNPVFLPSDPPYTWLMAKMWVNLADSCLHQAKAHLGFTHLIAEALCTVTHRELSPSHPVFRLLAPHFLYLIAINSKALAVLVSPGGYIDKSMAMGRVGLFDVIRKCKKDWRLDIDGIPEKEFENRGVGKDVLPHYPYRDDANSFYEVIHQYVSDVIHGFYTEEKLIEDHEIQSWYKLLSTPADQNGAGFEGVPGNGETATLEDIVTILTITIFTSSVQHAAVNFNQYDQYSFPAVYPAHLNCKPPTTKDALTESDVVKALPNPSATADIMLVTNLLSERGTNALGDFEVQYGYHPVAQSALDKFRSNLAELRTELLSRYSGRKYPYTILDPKEIPNAISI